MGSEKGRASQDDRDTDDEEEYEEAGGGNRLLGFMFGNVDDAGELDVDYLDEDAKEHLDALADKLGPSLTDIDLSGKSSQAPIAALDEDYDEKADDAVDYEDIDEQYEGPETQVTEEDHLLPQKDYLSSDVVVATLENKSSVFDDENYDEDEDCEKEADEVPVSSDGLNAIPTDLGLDSQNCHEPDMIVDATAQTLKSKVQNEESDAVAFDPEQQQLEYEHFDSVGSENDAADSVQFQEEKTFTNEDATNLTPLPVLCIEDGVTILRFSEIFGLHEPLKKREKRERRYTFPKDKYEIVDASHIHEEDIAEDDEEAFLRGPTRGFYYRKAVHEFEDEISIFPDDCSDLDKFDGMLANGAFSSAFDKRKDSCFSAQPMGVNLALDQSQMSPEFHLLDQQDWEDRIVWGNSPSVADNRAESCELDGPSSEIPVNEEMDLDLDSGAEILSDDTVGRPRMNRKFCATVNDYDSIVSASGTSETFSSKDIFEDAVEPVSVSCSGGIYHPQLLRLESQLEKDSSDFSDLKKRSAYEDHQQKDLMHCFGRVALQNTELMDGSWLDNIIWDSVKNYPKPKLILDLQDENMLFEVLDGNDEQNLQHRAGAMIITRTGKSGDLVELRGHSALSGARFNIANDKFYSNRKTVPQLKSLLKKRTAHGVKILHSIPALKLQTMKPKLSNKDIANFHRPKALWFPHDNEVAVKERDKLPTLGPMKIILKSLGGKGCKLHVDAEETISSLKNKASKKLDFRQSEFVKIFYSGKELQDEMTLSEQNVRTNSLLHLVRTKVHLLPMAQKLPGENKSLRPPGAFKKKSDLSVKDGHVFLMEYCEERPLLLGNAGMGARLCTYYQKLSPDDQAGDALRSINSGLGTVITLDPADKSPFLGDIKPGCYQSSIETNMSRAPVFPHKVASTDYLLVRSAKGKLSIRRIDRVNVVGQQEPHMEVMAPGAKGLQTYIMNRLLAFMYREFRDAEKRGVVPCIRADELSAHFPNISEPFLRKRLKHCADLQKRSSGQLLWVMRRSFHIPSEEVLRRMVTPENVCTYESMQAGMYRLKRLGITRLAHLTGPTQLASLSSAMNQLPDEAIALAAASHIERELQITPWNLSSNFVACTSQDRENIERLEITGVGDPSGRGLGFSYVRLAPKAPVSNAMVKKKPVVGRNTTVTGTDADLRRLSMDAAREVLVKFNVPEEQIEKLTRWHRIAMIRKLSSDQATSGVEVDPTTISKYARGQRMSFLQLQQQTREKCQDIWDRQIQSLSAMDGDENESDSEANSDLDSFAGDLENLLDAEECEEDEADDIQVKNDKSNGVRGLKMRRHPSQVQLEEEIEDEAAEAAELFRMLMDDGDLKKKRSKVGVKVIRAPGFEDAERGKKPARGKQAIVTASDTAFMKKQNASHELQEAENSQMKKALSGKVKATIKNDVTPGPTLKKKVKIEGVNKDIKLKERKSARERFVCGACGQLGHMKTNKNCPKYGEDTEPRASNLDSEKLLGRRGSLDPASHVQPKAAAKKMMPKTSTEVIPAENPDSEKSNVKPKFLKVKCGSVDKIPDKFTPGPTQSFEKPSTSEADGGNRPTPKVNKLRITNKLKSEDNQMEVHKPSIVIRPPTEAVNRKKVIIRRPKEIVNHDPVAQEGTSDLEFRKTKKIVDLTGSELSRMQENNLTAEKLARRKAKEDRRFWEEEENRRNAEKLEAERARRAYEEERRMLEEQERLAELRRYEEAIRTEREEEEEQRAKKKKKKKRRTELQDGYLEDYRASKKDGWVPERDRAAKRKSVAHLGRIAAEHVPSTKRRRGGQVLLANILESILETLKAKREISFLFIKPVSKKEAPDYLDIVQRPMDLSTIREKVRRFEYKDRQEFRHDVWQITYNAHLYNDGRHPGIPPLADQLLEICDYLLSEHEDGLNEAEDSIRDG